MSYVVCLQQFFKTIAQVEQKCLVKFKGERGKEKEPTTLPISRVAVFLIAA